jgi:periplasmic divalent cation tolerance protein
MTAPSVEAAETIVRALVDERLVACGNIVPGVTSIYRWEGEVQRETEALVVLKATANGVEALIRRAAELHPYGVPELLAIDVAQGFRPYMDWVASSSG